MNSKERKIIEEVILDIQTISGSMSDAGYSDECSVSSLMYIEELADDCYRKLQSLINE